MPDQSLLTLTDNAASADEIQQQVIALQQWLTENPQINASPEEGSLCLFLHSAKYNVELAKVKIVSYYHMRAVRGEWFHQRDPFDHEVQAMLSLGVFLPVDGVDAQQRKVVIVRTAAHSPKLHTINSVFKASMMVLDLLLHFEPENCARGIVAIFDMADVTLGHALQLAPKLIKRVVDSWQTYPCQPKRFEFINSPHHVNFVLNTFRIFMTPKMRSRVFVQRNNCTIQSDNLPKNITKRGHVTYEQLACKWKQLVEANVEFYAKSDKYKSILTT